MSTSATLEQVSTKTQVSSSPSQGASNGAIIQLNNANNVVINKPNLASDKDVMRYCDLVAAGKPTGKVFPNKLSEMEFTDEQRDAIRTARAEHKLNCMNAKKNLLAMLRSKKVETVGHRTNRDGTSGSVKYVHHNHFKTRKGEFSAGRFDRFVFGATPKATK